MRAVQELSSEPVAWPTQAAEELAAEAAAAPSSTASQLQRTPVAEVWSCSSRDGRVTGLFRTATLRERLPALAAELSLPQGVRLVATAPQEPGEGLVVDTSLGSDLGGWRLGLAAEGNPLDDSSQARKAVHAWIALLVVAATCVLGWLLASALRRRLRLGPIEERPRRNGVA